MGVYIGGGKDYSAMRGPCPEGFHIPSHIEWQNLKNLLTRAQIIGSSSPWGIDSYNVLKTALKLPMTGVRNRSGTYTTNNYYWGCDGRTSSGGVQYGYLLHYNTSNFSPSSGQYRSYGCPIRPFSDNPINPMDGELLKEDWEYLDGSTMMGNVCARNPTLGVISVVYNGSQVITIADKNLGATTTYERNIYDESAVEPTLSEANCGKFYQWGNNYGFAYSGSLTTSSTQLDASSYGPGNYYSSSTFITPSSSPYDWSSVQNDNLWGGVTGVVSPAPLKNAYIGEVLELKQIFDFSTSDTHGFTQYTSAQSGLTIDTTNQYCKNNGNGYGSFYKQVNYKKCWQRINGRATGTKLNYSLICGIGNNYAPSSGISCCLGCDGNTFYIGIKGMSSYASVSLPSGFDITQWHYYDTIWDNGNVTVKVLNLDETVVWSGTYTASETTQKYIGFSGGAKGSSWAMYIKEYRLAYKE